MIQILFWQMSLQELLDTKTSIQIMELIKDIAKDKLVNYGYPQSRASP